jgi:hypothetical protein
LSEEDVQECATRVRLYLEIFIRPIGRGRGLAGERCGNAPPQK